MTVHPLILRFEEKLRSLGYAVDELLAPGISVETSRKWASAFSLPADSAFISFHEWRDGSRDRYGPALLDGMRFVPFEDAASHQETMRALIGDGNFDRWAPGEWWHPAWVPILDNGSYDVVCFDPIGCFGGVPGQIVRFSNDSVTRTVLASSFERWLEGWGEALRAGWMELIDGCPYLNGEREADRRALLARIDPGFPRTVQIARNPPILRYEPPPPPRVQVRRKSTAPSPLPAARVASWSVCDDRYENVLEIWDTAVPGLAQRHEGNRLGQSVRAVHLSPIEGAFRFGTGLVTWDRHGSLRLWDDRGHSVYPLDLHDEEGGVADVASLPSGALLSITRSGTLALHKPGVSNRVAEVTKSGVARASGLANGGVLGWSSAFADSHVCVVWEPDLSAVRWRRPFDLPLRTVLEIPGLGILVVTADGSAALLALQSGEIFRELSDFPNEPLEGQVVDSGVVLLGSRFLWRPADDARRFLHTDRAFPLRDGRLASVSRREIAIRSIKDVLDGREEPLLTLGGLTRTTLHLIETPDFIWAMGEDQRIRGWRSDDGAAVAVLEGHTGDIAGGLALGNEHLLSWANDRTLRLWHLPSKRLVATLPSALPNVEGAHVLSSRDDGAMR